MQLVEFTDHRGRKVAVNPEAVTVVIDTGLVTGRDHAGASREWRTEIRFIGDPNTSMLVVREPYDTVLARLYGGVEEKAVRGLREQLAIENAITEEGLG